MIIRDYYYYSRDYYCRSLVILVLGFSQIVAGQHLRVGDRFPVFFQIATVVTGHESALKLEKVNFSDGVTKNHSKSLEVTEKGDS